MIAKVEEYKKLTVEQLNDMISAINTLLTRMFYDSFNESFDEYKEKTKPLYDDRFYLETAHAMIIPKEEIKYNELLDWERNDCLIPIETYISWCKSGYVSSYDGHGVYATKDKSTNLYANPKAFREGYIRNDFDFVCWYNK